MHADQVHAGRACHGDRLRVAFLRVEGAGPGSFMMGGRAMEAFHGWGSM